MEEAYTSFMVTNVLAEDTVEMRKARPLTDKWTFSTNGVLSWAVMVSMHWLRSWRRSTSTCS
ncbi:MAG: hypothetical protein ACLRZ2_01070 [Veillonella sp.]